MGSRDLNAGCQAWQQKPLPSKSSPKFNFLFSFNLIFDGFRICLCGEQVKGVAVERWGLCLSGLGIRFPCVGMRRDTEASYKHATGAGLLVFYLDFVFLRQGLK